METIDKKSVYRIQGFTCAGCASKFEKNVKQIPGVTNAQVNFGASKITVFGEATFEEIERAGALESLKVIDENEHHTKENIPFWKKPINQRLIISSLFLIAGFVMSRTAGEESITSMILFGISILLGGTNLFIKGIRNLFHFEFDMETLMTIAILGAIAIGEWSEGATVVILFAISEALERYSMDKARQSIRSLMDITPKKALIRRENQETFISVDEIQVDDIMIVKPGQKIAMDGVVVKGISSVNQAPITGESIPVRKTVDDEVFAGTLNGEGLLEVRITKRAEDTTIAKIIHLVEEAQAERAPSQAFVDRFAKYYTPAILILGLLIAILPPLFFNGDWSDWIYRGLALLVVGCPCALVISTPVAIVTAIGKAAKNGVLIKGGIHLEAAGGITTVAFDKTGTLTKGLPVVTNFMVMSEQSEHKLLQIAAVMEKYSQHPLASAVMRYAEQQSVDYDQAEVDYFSSLTGKGIEANMDGRRYYIGSPLLFQEMLPMGIPESVQSSIHALQIEGKTVMLLGTKEHILALIAVADEMRENSKETIQKLHQLGIERTVMLTGDNQATAKAIGNRLGINEIEAELLPHQKVERIKQYRSDGSKVAMVGDGVNDAPALAAATVGIAMGGAGTDTALETADIALMGDDPTKLPFTVKLSRKTLGVIKQNITFALAIKATALLLIIPGLLTLWLAVFADMGATLIVTLNALRLLQIQD